MCAFVDRTNIRYGRLVAIKVERIEKKKGAFWLCKCDCGNETVVRGNVLGKNSSSCGCLKKEQDKENLGRFINGRMKSRLGKCWYGMKQRCYKKEDVAYKWYGDRGIKVCEEWINSYENFEKWALLNGYQEHLTLDRIDVNGNYEPSNCRWATYKEQSLNKRNTLYIEHNGEIKSLKSVYEMYPPKVSYATVCSRYRKGIRDIEKLFEKRRFRGK